MRKLLIIIMASCCLSPLTTLSGMDNDEKNTLITDEVNKWSPLVSENGRQHLYKVFYAGMSKEWIEKWARTQNQDTSCQVFYVDDVQIRPRFVEDTLVSVSFSLGRPVSPESLIEKYRKQFGKDLKVTQKKGEPSADLASSTDTVIKFIQKNSIILEGPALRIEARYNDLYGVIQILPDTLENLNRLSMFDQEAYKERIMSYATWKNNPADVIVDSEGSVCFNSRAGKKLLKGMKDDVIEAWRKSWPKLKTQYGKLKEVTLTGAIAEKNAKQSGDAVKAKAAQAARDQEKAEEAAALDF